MKEPETTTNGSAGLNGAQHLRTEKNPALPYNREIDPKTLDADFVGSIRDRGILQPLIVRERYRPEVDGRQYELVAGERRWHGAQLVKLESVPVIVMELSDTEAKEIQAIENLQRADLTPIEEAQAYQQLIDDYKAEGLNAEKSVRRLADKVGQGKATIYQALRLIKLPEPVKAAVASGKLPPSHAEQIARLEDAPEVQERLLKKIAPSGGETEDFVVEDMDENRTRDVRGVLSFRDTKQEVDREISLTKARLAWEKAAEEHRRKGGEVLTEEDRIKNRDHYDNIGVSYVSADKTSYIDGRYQSTKDRMGRFAPELAILTRSDDYRPKFVYRKKDVTSAIRQKTLSKPKGKEKKAIPARDSYQIQEQKRKEKTAKMAPVLQTARKLILEAGTKRGAKLPWQLIVKPLVEDVDEEMLAAVLKARGLSAKAGYHEKAKVFLGHLGQMPENKIPALLVELLVSQRGGGWQEWRSAFDPDFIALAKHYGVNLEKLTKELAEKPKKEPAPAKTPAVQTSKTSKSTAAGISAAGRKRLSTMMKARWAARNRNAGSKATEAGLSKEVGFK